MNPPLRRPPPPREPTSNAGTYLALVGIVCVALALLTLTAMVNIAVFGILVVVFGFGLLGVFHYLVWGWWLSQTIVRDDDEDHPR
ncbi:MAG TPA: hypothetical protein VHB77_09260 [Planctomycetaceae bacterium]|nr:hypothetical protein [Planctomycetaceae bacterium]